MTTLRVGCWNVLAEKYIRAAYYPHLERLPDPEWRVDNVAYGTGRVADAVDVLVLTELDTNTAAAVEGVLDNAGFEHRHHLRPGRTEGTLVAVRTELPARWWEPLHAGCGDHVAGAVTVTAGGVDITVCGTHLTWSNDTDNHPGVAQLRYLAEQLPARAVIAGDLNDETGPVITELARYGFGPTEPGAATAYIDGVGPRCIDWIVARGCDVTNTYVYGLAASPTLGPTPSDHLPVTAEVTA